jgi:hypothetical protein
VRNCNILRRFEYGIGYPFGFGWAAKGFAGDTKPFVPAALKIQPYLSEPDTRSGKKPEQLKGTLTASELVPGASCATPNSRNNIWCCFDGANRYGIYRWDTVAQALTYTDEFKLLTFTATGSQFVFADAKTFISSGTTYYRVVKM